jgi:hypothetical protein
MPFATPARSAARPLAQAVWVLLAFLPALMAVPGCKNDKKLTLPVEEKYLPQTSPANILSNLQKAYQTKDYDGYESLFSHDFYFMFDPAEVGQNGIPEQWSRADELTSARHMFADSTVKTITLNWAVGSPAPSDDVIPESWKVRVDNARLSVNTRNENNELFIFQVPGDTEVFYFRQSTDETVGGQPKWYLIRWDDSPISGLNPVRIDPDGARTEKTSWGRIKMAFR